MTAVAFEHFARMACDVVVCEVGLGGRLDSTNVIAPPEVCVITRIGLDHTDFLGDTVEAVAGEKAGIIKRGSRAVSWPQEPGAQRVIDDVAHDLGVVVSKPDFNELTIGSVEGGVRAFTYRSVGYTTKLLGSYQPSNAALALEAVFALKERGWNIPDEAIRQGIADTSWPGRFEIVSAGDGDNPTIIVDGGHNPQGAAVLAESLRNLFEGRDIVFVMSVLGDKDYRGMIAEVAPLASAFICATPPNPRALASDELAAVIREAVDPSVSVKAVTGFSQAIEEALACAGPAGTICIFGSLYSIADIKQALEQVLNA
jgi:dihydrofolate synthase/folylpolyglutamate synthase